MPALRSNPYVGPRTFREEDADFFFGRDRESRDLLALVISNRLALFYSQSGAGKSSLINTRLLPGLRNEGFLTLPVVRVGGEIPDTASGIENVFVYNLLLNLDRRRGPSNDSVGSYRRQREGKGLESERLGRFLGYLRGGGSPDEQNGPEPMVLVIDQFEEIFTSHLEHWAERTEFFRQVNQALENDPLLWIVLAMREDHVGALAPYLRLLKGQLKPRFYMQRMERSAALDAVRNPAAKQGCPFASGTQDTPDAAEVLVDNLRSIRTGGTTPRKGQFVEPVHLQLVCAQLWESLRGRTEVPQEITLEDLQEAGDVDEALSEFYLTTVRQAVAETDASELEVHRWFKRTAITESRTRGTVHRAETMTGSLDNETVEALARRFLLRPVDRAGGIWYELSHDRFIDPVLDGIEKWWLTQGPLVRAAEKWQENDRDRSYLLRGEQLEQALREVDLKSVEPAVATYLNASSAANQEREEQLKISKRVQRSATWLAILGGGFLSFSVILALVFTWAMLADPEHFQLTPLRAALLLVSGIFLYFAPGAVLGWLALRIARGHYATRRYLRSLTRKWKLLEESRSKTPSPAARRRQAQSVISSTSVPVIQRGSEGKLGQLSPQYRQALAFAPLWVFLEVAPADGRIDRLEVKALVRAMRRRARRATPEVKTLLRSTLQHLDETLIHFESDPRTVETGLRQVAVILKEKVDDPAADELKSSLSLIGERVARASRGGPWRLGRRVTEAETAALNRVAHWLEPPATATDTRDTQETVQSQPAA